MYLMIQKRKKTVEKGRPVETWEDYFKCWCDVKSLYGKELYEALEAKLENVLNFETRFCGKLEALNTKEYRVKWGERLFNIINVDYGKYERRKIVLKAQEII
ncbi:head-tail adaptor protein [bacterium C-53]|jgi:phage head-tail adaptor, putative, SPP1 family|nr:head-tail adaptor protein [Lachnospiraceae bacterium]NBI03906.1 head-tail adaptor protein [Lachnospiraceae bacterium]RKJ09047.1 head-tail adaptor protein [bacterium C-53]